MAVLGMLLGAGKIDFALALVMAFGCYLRPREITSILVGQLLHKGQREWLLLLNPEFLGIRSKGRAFDDALPLDTHLLDWIHPFCLALTEHRNPMSPLFAFNHRTLMKEFKAAVTGARLDVLKPSLYSLRHGGASSDIIAGRRSVEAVKLRGRWSSDQSLLRYKKVGRAVLEVQKIDPQTLAFGQAVSGNLEHMFLHPERCQDLIARCFTVPRP